MTDPLATRLEYKDGNGLRLEHEFEDVEMTVDALIGGDILLECRSREHTSANTKTWFNPGQAEEAAELLLEAAEKVRNCDE